MLFCSMFTLQIIYCCIIVLFANMFIVLDCLLSILIEKITYINNSNLIFNNFYLIIILILLWIEMTNKPVSVGIVWTVPILTGNPRIDWVWVWGIPDFFNWVWGWLWDVHIPAISPSLFKLLKYSQLIK